MAMAIGFFAVLGSTWFMDQNYEIKSLHEDLEAGKLVWDDMSMYDMPMPGRDSRSFGQISATLRKKMRLYGQMSYSAYADVQDMRQFGNVILANAQAVKEYPVFYVVEREPRESVVLVIRGTKGSADWVTNIKCRLVKWRGKSPVGYVHNGMAAAAMNIFHITKHILSEYQKVVVTGHSLGGSVGIYITLLLQELRKNVHCLAFGAPPTLQAMVALTVKNITSIIHRNDVVPRLPIYSHLRGVGKLHSAGTVILKTGDKLEVLHKHDGRRKPNIIISKSMISDHQLAKYIDKKEITKKFRPVKEFFGSLGRGATRLKESVFNWIGNRFR